MPRRKIYDIIPPHKRVAPLSQPKAVSPAKPSFIPAGVRGVSKKNVFLFGFIVLAGLMIYWIFSVAQSVTIELWPKTFPVDLTTTATFFTGQKDFDLSQIELANPIIPAEFLEIEKSFNKEFNSSKVSVEEKATGVVRLYNKQSRNIPLVEGTRLLSSTEPTRQFHLQKRVVVPANGNIDAPVIATEAGPEYNIEPASFSIPGLRNYSPPQLYYDVFGKSLSKMEGGRITETYKISQEDVERAKEQALEAMEAEAVSVMQEKAGDDYRVINNSIETEVLEQGLLDTAVGQETRAFVYQIKFKAGALAVKRSYLRDFAKEYLITSIPANKDFEESDLAIDFLPNTFAMETDENGESRITSDISIAGKVYSQIDKQSLKEVAKNRTKKEILRYVIEIYPEVIKEPRVIFRPFWARRSTSEVENIEIKMNF